MGTILLPGSVITIPAGDSRPGLGITFAPSHPAYQNALQPTDFFSLPILRVYDIGSGLPQIGSPGDQFTVLCDRVNGPGITVVSVGATVGWMWWPDPNGYVSKGNPLSVGRGLRMFFGTGVPSTTTVNTVAAVGDLYRRKDGGIGTSGYRCEVAGTSASPLGTWVARW